MKGNDLVDLQQAFKESNWMRRGFLRKLFTAPEQQMIMLSSCRSEMVWLIWSMKEAAYKIHNTNTGVREFAPLKLNCKLHHLSREGCIGEVRIDDQYFFTKTHIHSGDYIHSVAAVDSSVLSSVRSTLLPISTADYISMNPACVSHHGRYLALIF